MRHIVLSLLVAAFAFPVLAQQEDQFSSESESVIREKKKKNADGSEETEIRSGKVKPKREGGPRVGEIYGDDQRRVTSRVESLSFWSFDFGPGSGSNVGNNAMFYNVSAGRHWEVNTNAEIRATGAINVASKDSGSLTTLALGGSWLTSTADISPIVGAEFGYGIATASGRDTMSGFAIGAHAGARFFRTAKTQLSLEGNIKTVLISDTKPVFYGLQLGILF